MGQLFIDDVMVWGDALLKAYFLNLLNDCHFCGEMLMNGFCIMQGKVGNSIDEKIYQKFSWHMNFVNSELDRKNERKDRKYRLSVNVKYSQI